ncbi:hypothetical protein D3C78_1803650 [compost metagenome]
MNSYKRHVPVIVETEDLHKKSKLIVTHLGALVKEMCGITPRLSGILEESEVSLDCIIEEIRTHS